VSPDERVPESPWQPPRTWHGELWRLVLCVAFSTLAWWQMAPAQWRHDRLLFALDLGLGLVAFALVLLRRRRPWAVALTLNLLGVLSSVAAGPAVLATVSFATRRQLGRLVPLGILGVAAGWIYSLIEPQVSTDPKWLDIGFNIVANVAIMSIGMYIGSRRELLWSLRARAEDAERQQELRLDQARARERERIAREMHDVLGHRISLITMHAGALTYRDDLAPEQVRETAELIATTSHEALVDLREVLGALRDSESVRPQPTLAALPELIEDALASGMRVEVENDLAEPAAVPARLGRAVYRMVQEALTNARKHEPDTPVRIRLSGNAAEGLTVAVRNGRSTFRTRPALPGSGLGLVGMRERFELTGGHLNVYDADRWFIVEGWLPWQQ